MTTSSIAPGGTSSTIKVAGAATAAFAGDAPDPDEVYAGGTYYAFTTGTALGNYLQVLTSTSPTSGFGPYNGQSYGSSALPNPPSWEQTNTQTSPGVFSFGGQWIMFYDAAQSGHASDTTYDCLSVATSPTLSPPVFTDTSTQGLVCDPGLGVIDPDPFVDPASGIPYLIWKTNDGGSGAEAQFLIQQLGSTGTTLVGSPHVLMTQDSAEYSWETTIEDPSISDVGGKYYLLFSGGNYQAASYSQGLALCQSVLGPCSQPQANPILSSYGSGLGPGGGSLFQDAAGTWMIDYDQWEGGNPGCTNYGCGAERDLFVASMPVPPF